MPVPYSYKVDIKNIKKLANVSIPSKFKTCPESGWPKAPLSFTIYHNRQKKKNIRCHL